jgi:hypothetical protein
VISPQRNEFDSGAVDQKRTFASREASTERRHRGEGVGTTMTTRRRNHAAWIGPLVAAVGLVSYFALAVKVPALRDSAAANLLVVGIGVGISLLAVRRRPSWKSWLGLVGALAFAALLAGYVLVLSKQLPSSAGGLQVGDAAPPLALPDQNDRLVDLAELSDRRVVVLFYRGFW